MRMAIAVMRKSVSEPRPDGKFSPRVGAVIRKSDGKVETAYRGELRHGDHAEYSLLERKNANTRLDGASMFTTLEPCAPGSRNHPKLSCAERIVLARITDVWIGIEDPDPTVDRKGIKYLQENGVTVHLFDRKLQGLIRKANKDFIAQALKRAEAAGLERTLKEVALSNFEYPVATARLTDLSLNALERYRTFAKIRDSARSEAFNRRLLRQGLLKKDRRKLVPTGFGLLLFGSEPREFIPQAGLLGTIHYSNGREETRDFDGPLVLIPRQVEIWLREKLPSFLDRSRMHRKERPALPFDLIREAVVNALMHRNYEIDGAKCHLVIREHTVTVRSPGGPPRPVMLEQLQSLEAPMLSRNPKLHYVFSKMKLAEERGFGMETFRSLPEKVGLPLPKYSFRDPYLVLTLYRSSQSAVQVLEPRVKNALKKDERAGWEYLASRITSTKTEYAKHLGFDDRKAQRHLKRFVELGLIRRIGRGPATQYRVERR